MKICLSCSQRFTSTSWQCPGCGWAPSLAGEWPTFAPELASGNNGFSPEFFATLFQAESGHFWFRSRNHLLIWTLRTRLPRARSLFEVGCGTGYVLEGIHKALPDLVCSGGEVFLEGLSFAQSRLPGVALSQMSAEQIPFDSEFDVVGAFDVLEHVPEDERALGQMFRAVRAGGGIVVTVPQHQFLWSSVDEHSFHKRRYSRSDLVRKLEGAGFHGIQTTSFVSLLLPLMFVTRMARNCKQPSEASADLRIGRVANSILERVMSLERFLIARGLSLPFGGSLLAVAYKPQL